MARDTSKLVTIPGELHSAATGNIVVAAEEVFDYTTNKYQKDINQEVAYIKEDSSVDPIPSFNPQSQTVHVDEQVLSNAQKKQVRKNIGLGNGDIDSTPTSGSDNVVRSGGVYSSMQELRSTVNPQVGYYTCSTAGNTAEKVIDASGYTLLKGGGLRVNFTEKNTAANATLNIEQTGAKPLYYNGVRVSTNNSWYAGEIMTLFYDGAAFQLNSLPDLDEYDVSARNGGQAFTFEEAVALVPEAYRHGGLKLRFISNSDSSISDNKYVQYRLMATAWSNIIVDWQGVDNEPTSGSDNLVKSGGVAEKLYKLEGIIDGTQLLDLASTGTGLDTDFQLVAGKTYTITLEALTSSPVVLAVFVKGDTSVQVNFTAVGQTKTLTPVSNGVMRLYNSTGGTWTCRLKLETGEGFVQRVENLETKTYGFLDVENIDITEILKWNVGFIDSSLQTDTNNTNYKFTNPIRLTSGKCIIVRAYGYKTTTSIITRCDINGENLEMLCQSNDGVTDYLYTNQTSSDVYVKVCVAVTREYNVSLPLAVSDLALKSSVEKPLLKIGKIDNTHFYIDVPNESNTKTLRHTFYHKVTTQVVGDSNMLTHDCWYADSILNEKGEQILQGNTNFIHRIYETPTNTHNGYCGSGDGNAIALWSNFFADGKLFSPENLTEEIACTSFRFTTKIKIYLSDGTKITDTKPALDAQGNPIIESYNFIDFSLGVGNDIQMRNRLTICREEQMSECHASMCCGFYPFFNNVIVNDKDGSWNRVKADFSVEKMGGTTLDLSTNGYVKCDTVILFGDDYRITNRIVPFDRRISVCNIRPWFPSSSENRFKFYLMPIVTANSAQNIADGEPIDTLHNGDVIDVMVYRKIDL